MKLAEALILRADCQKRIGQLKQRLIGSVKVQEGETPSEDPQALIAELNGTVNELADLIKRINKTNSATNLQEEITISDALAERDTLMVKRGVYSSVIEAAAFRKFRYSASEIKIVTTVSVAEMQAQMDQMSRQYRELDTRIQSV